MDSPELRIRFTRLEGVRSTDPRPPRFPCIVGGQGRRSATAADRTAELVTVILSHHLWYSQAVARIDAGNIADLEEEWEQEWESPVIQLYYDLLAIGGITSVAVHRQKVELVMGEGAKRCRVFETVTAIIARFKDLSLDQVAVKPRNLIQVTTQVA